MPSDNEARTETPIGKQVGNRSTAALFRKKCSIPEPTGIIQKRSEMRHRRASNSRPAPLNDTRDGERDETRHEY